MIIALGYIVYRLIMRFPIIVLLIYGLQYTEQLTSEEEVQRVELSSEEILEKSELKLVSNNALEASKYYLVDYHTEEFPLYNSGFKRSAYIRLCILYSSMMDEERELV